MTQENVLSPRLTSQRPKVFIVGGGFAGLEAAKRLATASVQVTLVDSRNYHLFQPLLYQVATATLSPADIASPIRGIKLDQKFFEYADDLNTLNLNFVKQNKADF